MASSQDDTVRTYVQLSTESTERLRQVFERIGQKQVRLLSRVVDWFCNQDSEFQLAVATKGDAVGKLSTSVDRLFANEIDPASVGSITEAAHLIGLLVKRIEELEGGNMTDRAAAAAKRSKGKS